MTISFLFARMILFLRNATYGGENNLEVKKTVKKVKQSYLKIVQGELKQYQKR